MPVRASRRSGADPVADFIALAADPERFQQAKDELDARRAAAEAAEKHTNAAVAAAKAEQDRLAKDRAEFNTKLTEEKATLARDRIEFNTLAKAENTRLVTLSDELANRERDVERRERDCDERQQALTAMAREAADAALKADADKATAQTALASATSLKAKYASLVEKIQRFGVELQA